MVVKIRYKAFRLSSGVDSMKHQSKLSDCIISIKACQSIEICRKCWSKINFELGDDDLSDDKYEERLPNNSRPII